MKLSLKGRQIPRNKVGDPAFTELGERGDVLHPNSVLQVFTPEEVVELVNRSLYQLEYQARSHSKYRDQRVALERPVREMFKVLYPHESFAKATEQQLAECIAKLGEMKT